MINVFALTNINTKTVAQSAENFGGAKMFDFRRIGLFCLGYRLSKHKITICSKHFGGHGSLGPSWLHLCTKMVEGKLCNIFISEVCIKLVALTSR